MNTGGGGGGGGSVVQHEQQHQYDNTNPFSLVNNNNKTDNRNPKVVLDQYLEKFVATKEIPDVTKGDPTTYLTKEGLESLLEKNKIDKEYADNFIKKLGIYDDDTYYIKVKDGYMVDNTQLINVDSEREIYLDKFKSIIDTNN